MENDLKKIISILILISESYSLNLLNRWTPSEVDFSLLTNNPKVEKIFKTKEKCRNYANLQGSVALVCHEKINENIKCIMYDSSVLDTEAISVNMTSKYPPCWRMGESVLNCCQILNANR